MCSRCDQLTAIQSIITDIDYIDVVGITSFSVVIRAPSPQLALITSDVLLQHGIISKTFKAHFSDHLYILIQY